MSRFLFRLGHSSARHPWRVVLLWVLAAVVAVGLRGYVGGEPNDDFQLPGTETQAARDLLEEQFPEQAGSTGQVVFAAESGTLSDPANRTAVEATIAELRTVAHVVDVSDPFDARGPTLSPDGRIGFTTVTYDEQTLDKEIAEATEAATEVGRDAGLQVEVSGSIMASAEEVEGRELIGLTVAVVVLLVAFGSLVATGVPIGTALFGLFIGLAGVGVLAGITDVPTVSPMLATMIGLGVGIDYALFVVTRHRQFLHEGWSVPDAAGRANATAGQAVLFAGMTVVIAILGLVVAGIPSVATMGFAAAIVVLVAMVGAVTLLPAFLGLAGHRIDSLRIGRHRGLEGESHRTLAGRWADHVGRRPWRYALASLGLLLVLAAPLASMRVAFADDSNRPVESTSRRAYDLLAEGFGVGFNGPLTVVVDLPTAGGAATAVGPLSAGLAADPGVASVSPAMLSPSGQTAVLFAYPTTAPQDEATTELVHRLRDSVVPPVVASSGAEVHLAGWQAAQIDISERMSARLPAFIGAVVGLSFLLLMMVFRSVLVPLKAAVMNLLSIGAAYGVVVAVFQWGWMKDLVGLDETVPIFPFLPMIMFAILFGLSMDYEVFLLSRVREEFVRSGDSHRSVVDGLASTARVITSAALIMISVFGAFIASSDVTIKMFGLGLATAVLIDATVVRMVLVPATMALLGNANWWLPRWLDRLLPHVDVDGTDSVEQLGGRPGGEVPAGNDEDLEPVGA